MWCDVMWCGDKWWDVVLATKKGTRYYKIHQNTITYYSVLHSTTKYSSVLQSILLCTTKYCSILQSTSRYYSVPHSTTKYHSVLQSKIVLKTSSTLRNLWTAKPNGSTTFMFDSRVVTDETSSTLLRATYGMQNNGTTAFMFIQQLHFLPQVLRPSFNPVSSLDSFGVQYFDFLPFASSTSSFVTAVSHHILTSPHVWKGSSSRACPIGHHIASQIMENPFWSCRWRFASPRTGLRATQETSTTLRGGTYGTISSHIWSS